MTGRGTADGTHARRRPLRPAPVRTRHRPELRRGLLAAASAVALLVLSQHAAPARARSGIGPGLALTHRHTTIAFWAGEAVPGTDWSSPDTYWNPRSTRAYTPHLWRVLRRYRIPLYFNLRYRRDFGPVPTGEPHRNDALRVIRTANRLGVPVWGWVLVPYAAGYWAWEGDAAQQFAAVKALVRWAREKHARLRGIALDPEPRLLTPFGSMASLMGGGGASFASLFGGLIDPAAQCAALRRYARIPRWAARRHIGAVAAPLSTVLDDIGDGNLALQDAANFILPPGPWNALYFQAYRSVFGYYLGHDPGPGIVSSYLRSAQRRFGSVGEVSLGSAGVGPYRRFAALLHDVRLAATLGASEVPIYSLERVVHAYGGPRAIIRLVRAARHPYSGPAAGKSTAPTVKARAVRAAIRHTDRLATSSTGPLTAARGTPQQPNAWPDGCSG